MASYGFKFSEDVMLVVLASDGAVSEITLSAMFYETTQEFSIGLEIFFNGVMNRKVRSLFYLFLRVPLIFTKIEDERQV